MACAAGCGTSDNKAVAFLSNRSGHSEIWVTDVLWPDFRKENLWEAFGDYGRRVRKFGAVAP